MTTSNGSWAGGKGSKSRPTNLPAYRDNHDKIEKTPKCPKCNSRLNMEKHDGKWICSNH